MNFHPPFFDSPSLFWGGPRSDGDTRLRHPRRRPLDAVDLDRRAADSLLRREFRITFERTPEGQGAVLVGTPRRWTTRRLKAVEVMKARDVMSRSTECVSTERHPGDRRQADGEAGVGSMPICGEDDRLKGMLTDRDIVVKAVARGKDVARTLVCELARASRSRSAPTTPSARRSRRWARAGATAAGDRRPPAGRDRQHGGHRPSLSSRRAAGARGDVAAPPSRPVRGAGSRWCAAGRRGAVRPGASDDRRGRGDPPSTVVHVPVPGLQPVDAVRGVPGVHGRRRGGPAAR